MYFCLYGVGISTKSFIIITSNATLVKFSTTVFQSLQQRRYKPPPENPKKKLEINLQDAIINGRIKDVELIITLGKI